MRISRAAWGAGAIFLLAILARALPGPRTIDDAFITFRYARHWVEGAGLVYNPGEAVLGTTTPLYTLLMAALARLAGGKSADLPALAWAVNAIADGVTCVLLLGLARRLGAAFAGVATAIVWAVAPMAVTFSIGGMETSVFIALMTATFYLHSMDRPVGAALAASLSVLTRPDALLFVLPLAAERARRAGILGPVNGGKRIGWAEAAALLSPLLLWTAYAIPAFGSPIPHSITAKVAAYHLPPEAGLVRLIQHYATPFFEQLTLGTGPAALLGLWGLHSALFGLGALAAIRHRPSSWAIFLYPWLYLAIFATANPLIFRWYLAPPLPVYFLGIFAGVQRVSRDLRFRPLPYLFAAAAVGSSLRAWTAHPDHGPDRPAPAMAFIQLELLHRDVAEWLRPRMRPGEILAAGDIGALGYYSDARILDTIGLISPASIPYYPLPPDLYVINYAIPPDLIRDLQPDYLVLLEVYGRNGLLVQDWFAQEYHLLRIVPTDLYESDGLLIYQRTSP
ncbi:MAG: hypothetical protein WD906_05050 [Anaerolineales bacterium]